MSGAVVFLIMLAVGFGMYFTGRVHGAMWIVDVILLMIDEEYCDCCEEARMDRIKEVMKALGKRGK